MGSLLSIGDLSKEELLALLREARLFMLGKRRVEAREKILASCFFEPSTRTRLSFEVAMKRLGGEVVGFAEASSTSAQKGESLSDTVRIIGSYVDLIVLRHPMEGAAEVAARATSTPILNAGDGSNEHPSQTLVDLFAIEESQGGIEGRSIALVGDLKFSRTVHSLVRALRHFDVELLLVSPEALRLPASLRAELPRCSEHRDVEEVIARSDVLYLTRLQKERMTGVDVGSLSYGITEPLLARAKPSLRLLHPLPRQGELPEEIDRTPFAYYFEQAAHGICVRQALIAAALELPCA